MASLRSSGGSNMTTRARSLLVLALVFILCALGSFAWELAGFDAFAPPSDAAIRRAAVAIVFTGDFARVDEALKLLAAGRVPRVYVSGVNGGAGLSKETFVAQFSKRNPELARLDKLVACCVEMGEAAENTFENARETRCWLKLRGIRGPLLLVTSRTHMARALALLSRAARGYQITPFPVEDEMTRSDLARSEEYLKFVQTLVLARIPGLTGLDAFSGAFATGGPSEP
jgi:uncharacterized SAM-binding protein YcdF (DUF218 family)